MSDIRTILVGTDLSARSDRAVRRAVRLARDHGAALTVLTAVDDAMPDDMSETLRGKAQQTLDRFVASIAEGVDYRVVAQVGDPTKAILDAAAAVDLLVMGVHRPRIFLDSLRETTMQRVVRLTGTPVLLVTDREDHPYARVIAACDFSPAATAALHLAHRIAPEARIEPLHALHVTYGGRVARDAQVHEELETAFRREAEATARAWEETTYLPREAVAPCEIAIGSPLALLEARVAKGGVDLIAAGAHGRVGAAPALLGSLANDLMRDPPCDVLIARP